MGGLKDTIEKFVVPLGIRVELSSHLFFISLHCKETFIVMLSQYSVFP